MSRIDWPSTIALAMLIGIAASPLPGAWLWRATLAFYPHMLGLISVETAERFIFMWGN